MGLIEPRYWKDFENLVFETTTEFWTTNSSHSYTKFDKLSPTEQRAALRDFLCEISAPNPSLATPWNMFLRLVYDVPTPSRSEISRKALFAIPRFVIAVVIDNPNSHNYNLNAPFLSAGSYRGIRKDGSLGNNLPAGTSHYKPPTGHAIKVFWDGIREASAQGALDDLIISLFYDKQRKGDVNELKEAAWRVIKHPYSESESTE